MIGGGKSLTSAVEGHPAGPHKLMVFSLLLDGLLGDDVSCSEQNLDGVKSSAIA